MLLDVGLVLLQVLLLLLLAPLFGGAIKKVKAALQSRRGPPLLQGYYDLGKLLAKDPVVSATSSWVFRCTPYIVFAATLVAGLLVPIVTVASPLGFVGDLIAVVYLLALARFFTALAGLDTGSAFGGLGSSREMFISALLEPALLLVIFTAALTSGSSDLGRVSSSMIGLGPGALGPPHALAFAALFIVAIAETGRIPVDNPATHLELTMVHEAMILEYSGRGLAFVEWASSIKQLVVFTILIDLFLPWGLAVGVGVGLISALLLYLFKLLAMVAVVALVETSSAKLRLFRVQDLLTLSITLSFLALVSIYITGAV